MDMTFSPASHYACSTPGRQENSGGWHHWQTREYEDTSVEDYQDRPTCEILPGGVFPLNSILPTWQQNQSARTALVDGIGNFAGVENSLTGRLNFMSHSDLIMPSPNPLLTTNDELNEGLGILGSTPLFNELDCASSSFNLQSHFAQSQPIQCEPVGLDSFNNYNMRDQGLLAPVSDQLFMDYQGPWNFLSNNDDVYITDLDCHDYNMHTPSLELNVQSHPQSLMMSLQRFPSDIPCSQMGGPLHGRNLPPQNQSSWGFGPHELFTEVPPPMAPNYPSSETQFHMSCEPPLANGLLEFEIDGFVQPAQMGRMLGSSTNIGNGAISSLDGNRWPANYNIVLQQPKKTGQRFGPLSPPVRSNANVIRKMGACVTCRIAKLTCTPHIVCFRCKKKYEKYMLRSPCCLRGPIVDYTSKFFPEVLIGHLGLGTTGQSMNQCEFEHKGAGFALEVSAGPFPHSMSLIVYEFNSTNQDSFLTPDLTSQSANPMEGFNDIPTLPYGLDELGISLLNQKCLQYIDEISKSSFDVGVMIIGDTSEIVWKTLGAIQRYQQANLAMQQDRILLRALRVFWMNYTMGRSFTLSGDFVSKTAGTLQNSSEILPDQPRISKLVNRQVKAEMYAILKDEVRNLLRDLEREWNSKNRKAFGLCFCTNLIIRMLIEQIAADIDVLVLHKIHKDGLDAARMHDIGMKACQELEDEPIYYSQKLFDSMQKRYNPMKNSCLADDESGQSEGEAALIKDIRELMDNYGEELLKLAAYPGLGGSSLTTEEHQRFLAQNSGRYVARFLLEFC